MAPDLWRNDSVMNDAKWPTDWPRLLGLALYELTTPLPVVHGYARLLRSGKIGASPEERHHAYAQLEHAARRVSEVAVKVRQLQAFETGRRWTTVERTEVSLENV